MYTKKTKFNRFYIFAIIIFLATTAFPSFLRFRKFIPILLPFIIYDIVRKRKPFNRDRVLLSILVIGCFALSHLLIGNTSLIGTVSFVLILSTIIAFSVLVQDSFVETYVFVMRIICYISFITWLLIVLIPGFHPFLASIGNNLPQLFTTEWTENTSNPGISLYFYYLPEATDSLYTSFIRNSGPFFEPGLLASYIVIALILNTIRYRKLLHRHNIILILTLLSTCSSAGYISLFLILVCSVLFKNNIYTKIITITFLMIITPHVLELDFMGDKVLANIEHADQSAASRFGAILYHSEKIVESPLIGFAGGDLPATQMDRFLGGYTENRLSPNGLSYCFVFWGIPLAIIFYVLLFNGIKVILPQRTKSWEMWMTYIIILSTAFSQTITTEPIMLLISAFSITKNNGAR